jgi:hypothetical protein
MKSSSRHMSLRSNKVWLALRNWWTTFTAISTNTGEVVIIEYLHIQWKDHQVKNLKYKMYLPFWPYFLMSTLKFLLVLFYTTINVRFLSCMNFSTRFINHQFLEPNQTLLDVKLICLEELFMFDFLHVFWESFSTTG